MFYAVLLALFVLFTPGAWSQVPAPSGVETAKPQQTQAPHAEQPATAPQQSTPQQPIVVHVFPTPKTEAEAQEDRQERKEKAGLDRRLVDLTAQLAFFTAGLFVATVALVLATIGLGYFGYRQSRDMKESLNIGKISAEAANKSAKSAIDQVEISNKSLIYSQRAFVGIKGFETLRVYDTTQNNKTIGWQITPIWENTGQTPTKKLYVLTGILPGEVPSGFKFEIPETDRKLTLISPKAIITGGTIHFTIEDILKMQKGEMKFPLIRGRAEYNDVFPGTRRHYTNFCNQIVFTGDPNIAESGIRIISYGEHNYTDEDYET